MTDLDRIADALGLGFEPEARTIDRVLGAVADLRDSSATRQGFIPAAEAALRGLRALHPKLTRKELIEASLVGTWVILDKRPQDRGLMGALRLLADELSRRPPAEPPLGIGKTTNG